MRAVHKRPQSIECPLECNAASSLFLKLAFFFKEKRRKAPAETWRPQLTGPIARMMQTTQMTKIHMRKITKKISMRGIMKTMLLRRIPRQAQARVHVPTIRMPT